MIDFKMNTNRHVWIWLMVYSLSTLVVAGVRQQRVIRQGEITEIISNSVTSGVSARISRGERVQRVRRGLSSLSAQDAQASLDKHNNLRKDEGAADMRQMVSVTRQCVDLILIYLGLMSNFSTLYRL